MRAAFVARLIELAANDPRVFLITGDLGFGVLTPFWERFPQQFLNVGVAEQNMTGLATGMALEGRTVFTYSIANFPTLRCLEQIRNDVCYHDANVKIVAVGGGFSYGALGISHHATEDLSILRSLPGMTVVAPGDAWEAGEATAVVASRPGPCYLRLDRAGRAASRCAGKTFRIGEATVVRQGADITLIACGGILEEVLSAAEMLAAQHGVQCRVVSMHTIKPIDKEAIVVACETTGGIVTVEEHTLLGGLGSAVAEVCMDLGLRPGAFARMGLAGEFSSVVGSQPFLRRRYGLVASDICVRVRELLAESRPVDEAVERAAFSS